MKIYRGKISYLLPILFFPVIISLAIILDGESLSLFLLLLVIPFILLMMVSLGYKLEVGSDFVRNSFLNVTLFKIHSSDVEVITYGGMGLWNSVHPHRPLTHGKGLAILANIKGVRKTHGLSEKLYGKDAIEHVKRVLETGK